MKRIGKQHTRLSWRETLTGYAFISPWLLGFFLFLLGPSLYSLVISFTSWDLFSAPVFVALRNYRELFGNDPVFIKALGNTLRFVATSVSISIVLALVLALLLNANNRAIYFFRTVIYIPSVVSGIAVAILWSWIFAPDFGILHYFLSLFGIKGPNWLGDPAWAPWAFVIIMSTTFVGAPMIIFVSGLQNIPRYLYEAADIDGANALQRFSYITLPSLSPIILFNTITLLIGAFRIFVQAYTLAGKDGYPAKSLLFYVMYLYKKGFTQMEMGVASAMAWIFFGIVFLLTAIIMRLSRGLVHYEAERREAR